MSRAFPFNFARRPFRDYRPVYLAAGIAFLVGAVFFALNLDLYADFRKHMEGTLKQIDWLEERQARASQTAEQARTALGSYPVSDLASESRELLRLAEERRFSWTALLAWLERTLPPEVRLARLTPSVGDSGEVRLTLALVGRSPQSVTRTIAALLRDPACSSVELSSETSPEGGVPEGHSFLLEVEYQPVREAGNRAAARKQAGAR